MTDIADITRRLQRLEDIEAIKQLKYRYFLHCDRKQPEQVRECFAAGPIVLDYGRIGYYTDRDDMLEVFTRLACVEHIVEMHHGQNPVVELTGPDTARASWGLYYYMINTRDNNVTQLGGYYDDEYRRTPAGWRITKSVYHVESTTLLDLASGPVRAVFAGRAAPAEIDDPSRQA